MFSSLPWEQDISNQSVVIFIKHFWQQWLRVFPNNSGGEIPPPMALTSQLFTPSCFQVHASYGSFVI
jgi:hypothetical protein